MSLDGRSAQVIDLRSAELGRLDCGGRQHRIVKKKGSTHSILGP
jgi:hypothetical protein